MVATLERFLSHINPNLSLLLSPASSSFSVGFEPVHLLPIPPPLHTRSRRTWTNISIVARTIINASPPKGRRLGFLSVDRIRVPFAAAASAKQDDDSESSSSDDVEITAQEEVWREILMVESLMKEQATRMVNTSQEAYELYSKRALVIFKDTSEKLKIQAERVKQIISEEGKEYLSAVVADKSAEEVKDIVETFAALLFTDDHWKLDASKIQHFYLGIPYGALLSLGGFLSFMLTGSISSVRFGVILGGALLASSISTLRSWKRGESSTTLAVKGQLAAAIAGIIFLRHLGLFFQRPSFPSCFTAFISGGMVVFYLYRIMLDGGQKKGPSLKHGTES